MKTKLVSLLVLYMLVGTMVPIMGLSGDAGDSPNAVPQDILIWEAYAKGDITVTMLSSGNFVVENDASYNVLVEEHVQLLSPSPLDVFVTDTTQDGVLTPTYTVSAMGVMYWNYYFEAPGYPIPPEPYWWCSEEHEFTEAGVSVTLGGEIMPYALQDMLHSVPLGDVQNQIWLYQANNPALVIGKTPLWTEIPDNQEIELDMQLAITNTGFEPAGNALVTDTIPAGYSYDPSSFSHTPYSISVDPSGNTIIRWYISLDAALWTDPTLIDPTLYDTEFITYTMKTPGLTEGKHYLPRAYVDQNDDVNNDAESARPVIEVYHVNRPPIANAGGGAGGFYYAQEGSTLTLDASASSDPDGTPLEFRWDLDSDGIWDTAWSTDPTYDMTQGDDVSGMVKLEVTDGEDSGYAFAYYLFENVAPTLDALDYVVTVNMPRTIGYWKRQCWDWLPPSPDHLGILPQYVSFIASSSQVFGGVQSKDDVCSQLEDVEHSDMLDKAEQQLMAVWLNVASGNLSFGTQVDIQDYNYTGTVGDFIDWAENVILNNIEGDMEKAKDIADYINNGIGVGVASVTFTASATDPGSDDLSFAWDFGDGGTAGPTWVYNDGSGPDPTPSPGGTYPFTATDTVSKGYMGLGTYTVKLTIEDDDAGEMDHTVIIVVG